MRPKVISFACLVLACCAVLGAEGGPTCSSKRPGAPKNVKLVSLPNSAIKATWTAASNGACVDNYLVIVRPSTSVAPRPGEFSPYQIITAYKPQVTIASLRPKTSYQVDIVPVSKQNGQGPYATATVETTGVGVCKQKKLPGIPVKQKARLVASRTDRIKVYWSAPTTTPKACITGYRVEGFHAHTGARVYSSTVTGELRKTTATGLPSGTPFKFYISAITAQGEGERAAVEITTAGAAAAPPAAPKPAPAAPVPVPAPAAAAAPTAPPPTAAASNTPNCRNNVEPSAPVDFIATPEGGDRIKVTWGTADANICTKSYNLDIYELKSGERVLEVNTPYTAYTATKLRPGIEYVFTVAAVNQVGSSNPGTAMATIQGQPANY